MTKSMHLYGILSVSTSNKFDGFTHKIMDFFSHKNDTF